MGRHRPTFDGQSLFFPQSVKPVQGVEINSGTHKVHPLLNMMVICHTVPMSIEQRRIFCRIWQINMWLDWPCPTGAQVCSEEAWSIAQKKGTAGWNWWCSWGIWAFGQSWVPFQLHRYLRPKGPLCWWCHQKGSFFKLEVSHCLCILCFCSANDPVSGMGRPGILAHMAQLQLLMCPTPFDVPKTFDSQKGRSKFTKG